ncbi:MAG: YfaP family protein [Gemmatimonadales bacterium]
MNGSRSFFRRSFLTAALGAAWAFTATCGKDSTAPTFSIADYISSVGVSGTAVLGVLVQGNAPAAGSGPTVTPSAPAAVINGGSAQVQLSGSAGFTNVILAVQGREDYYQITLPGSVTLVDLIVSLSQDIPTTSFNLQYAVGSGASVGAYAGSSIAVIPVGSGPVQVSVSWNVNSDVDLHLVEPGGEEIYYANSTSAAGGVLDLDSNAGCSIDGVRNENITYPSTTPPTGQYIVRVDYWDACGVAQTNYVVTVRIQGQTPLTFTGNFTGLGDQGGAGSGVLVTNFTY